MIIAKNWKRPVLSLMVSCACISSVHAAVPPSAGDRMAFSDPAQAVDSLQSALTASSKAATEAKLLKIFGPNSKDLLNTGDPVDDQAALDSFKHAFAQRVEVVTSHVLDASKQELQVAVLLVGEKHWPFPIALIKRASGWQFDTEVGRQEIIDRRIGENELKVLALFPEYVAAQREYASLDVNGNGSKTFATKFLSSPGKRDGLYWPAKAGQPLSPMGPLVAQAADHGYKAPAAGARTPFHGYYFRILTSQGKNARGGAMNYVVKGQMTGGFALLAYPAVWDQTGAMTFLVGPDGVVYQKNLGPKTAEVAAKISAFDPDMSWNPA